MLDASALIRLHKCESLDLLTSTAKLSIAEHAHGEFEAGGPSARAALARLKVTKRPIVPGSPEWKHFALVREEFSTVDLGEDQSIAVALAEADRDNPMPIVCYDDGAVRKAHGFSVATVSFLATLAWLVSCKRLLSSRPKSSSNERPHGMVGSGPRRMQPLFKSRFRRCVKTSGQG